MEWVSVSGLEWVLGLEWGLVSGLVSGLEWVSGLGSEWVLGSGLAWGSEWVLGSAPRPDHQSACRLCQPPRTALALALQSRPC